MKRKRLGEVLHARGKISAANLEKLFLEQHGKVIRLGELILERGMVDRASLIDALQDVTRILYLDCSTVKSEKAALEAINLATAERLTVLPVRMDNMVLTVAMAEPQNLAVIDELKFISGKQISPRLAFRSEILAAIDRNYKHEQAVPAPIEPVSAPVEVASDGYEMEFISSSARVANRESIEEVQVELAQKKTPAIRVVSEIIQQAMIKEASDIHIEPQAAATIVRIRVDGVLREIQNVPRSLQNSLISRIKILSDMDIAERRTPQDGRFMVVAGPRRMDVRVSSLPTQYGEKIVMRLLETNAPLQNFAELGIPPAMAERLSRCISLPQGMLLVTGPTGSGKSTTLYSILNMLHKPAVNIITVEDPVEYELPGINQVHVNTRAGLTFAGCLRSILRQDPNVIMVGEIRDLETAEIVMKAAQTGHFVLSTLHTNDSISAITRLLDLGIPNYLIASSLTAVLAQRLVRKLCSCHTFEKMTPEYAVRLGELGSGRIPDRIPRPVGCPACDNTGYKGRIGIYELLEMDESIRSALRGGFKQNLVRNAASVGGMKYLQEDALDKLHAGITTLEEIQRVVPFDVVTSTECVECSHELFPTFQYCPYCGAKRVPGESNYLPESTLAASGRVPS